MCWFHLGGTDSGTALIKYKITMKPAGKFVSVKIHIPKQTAQGFHQPENEPWRLNPKCIHLKAPVWNSKTLFIGLGCLI